MTSATCTRSLSQKRQTRLMRCLAAVDPGRQRPRADRVPRLTCTAAPTRSASVFVWLKRRSVAKLSTQPTTWIGDMAVPSACGRRWVWRQTFYPNHVAIGTATFFQPTQTGDDSARRPLVRPTPAGVRCPMFPHEGRPMRTFLWLTLFVVALARPAAAAEPPKGSGLDVVPSTAFAFVTAREAD